jgi:protein SCO1/2
VTPIAKTVALALAFVAIVLGMLIYSVTREPTLSVEQLRDQGVFVLPNPREIAPFELTTHTGEPFTLEDLKGKWSFVFFGFANCPDICPTAMSVLGQAQREIEEQYPELADEFQGVLVTVDPERDDRETLARYVQAFSADFIGVRGDRAATAQLATQLNVAFAKVPGDEGGYLVDHTANIVIINPYGHYHGFVKMPHRADTIASAFRSLEVRL